MSNLAEQNETNKLAALKLAKQIFQVCSDERLLKVDPQTRHKIVCTKYPNFAQAYPVILRWLARDLKYNEHAFRAFLDKLEQNPGKGMEGFIEHQADYAKLLYFEECKTNHKHPNYQFANKLFIEEHNAMTRSYKKIKEEERQARNEFEEEERDNLVTRRQELLDFINQADFPEESLPELDPTLAEAERLSHGLPLKNPNAGFGDINTDVLGREEMVALCSELWKFLHEKDLLEAKLSSTNGDFVSQQQMPDFTTWEDSRLRQQHLDYIAQIPLKDARIKELRLAVQPKMQVILPKVEVPSDKIDPWLVGTPAGNFIKKKKDLEPKK